MYSEVFPRMYAAGTHIETVKYDRQPFIMPNSMVRLADGGVVENTDVYSKGDKAWWTAYGNIQTTTAAKADFLKLRELYVGYELPAKFLAGQKLFKKQASVLLAIICSLLDILPIKLVIPKHCTIKRMVMRVSDRSQRQGQWASILI